MDYGKPGDPSGCYFPREWRSRAAVTDLEAKLKDPAVVHLNMLRGGIAKLTPAQIGHLYRGEEAREVIRELRRQNPELEP